MLSMSALKNELMMIPTSSKSQPFSCLYFVLFQETAQREPANASSWRFHALVEQMRPHGRPPVRVHARGPSAQTRNSARKLGKR